MLIGSVTFWFWPENDKHTLHTTNKTLSFLYRKNFCRDKIMFGQKFCRDKHTFVATKDVFCRDRTRVVCRDKNDTCGSSRQLYVYRMFEFLRNLHQQPRLNDG